jgi:hypothetical protein
MNYSPPLEEVIHYLTGPVRLQVNELIKALGLTRTLYYSWRRSTSQTRRDALAKRLIALFPENFLDGQIPPPPYNSHPLGFRLGPEATPPWKSKYIELLELTVKDLRAERDLLRQVKKTLLHELKEDVSSIQKRLSTGPCYCHEGRELIHYQEKHSFPGKAEDRIY